VSTPREPQSGPLAVGVVPGWVVPAPVPADHVRLTVPYPVARQIVSAVAGYMERDVQSPADRWGLIEAVRQLDPESGAGLYRWARYALGAEGGRWYVCDRAAVPYGHAPPLRFFTGMTEALDWRDNHAPGSAAGHDDMFSAHEGRQREPSDG
jgi:hypothetical protein